jgi:hypothetical protein
MKKKKNKNYEKINNVDEENNNNKINIVTYKPESYV